MPVDAYTQEYMKLMSKWRGLFLSPRKKDLLQRSEVFCMAPWVHQYIFPDGKVFPCCISAHNLDDSLGNLSKGETLEQVWNSEATATLRKNMLHNTRSELCRLCYQYEELGKKSSRQEFNEMFEKHIGLVDKTSPEGTLEKFDLKFIDFRFSNVCNLRCRSCSHHFSSKWFEEAKKLDLGTGADKSLIYPVNDIEELWQQILPILPGLEKVHFAGGEPLMMEEHYRILDFFIKHRKTDVVITYNTNFSDFRFKQYDVVEMWKHFKHVSILASLDAMGKRGEYMRKGIDWEKVEDNRRRLLREVPHVKFQLTPTVSIMNVLHLPDFYKDWLEKGLIKPKEINIYLLFEPYFYNIVNLPPHLKQAVREKYVDFIHHYLNRFDPSTREYLTGQFTTVLTHMNQEPEPKPADYYNGHTFKSYNQRLDEFRNEHSAEIFPEIKELMEGN